MAVLSEVRIALVLLSVLLLAVECHGGAEPDEVEVITQENFGDVLTGEWMLEFYAPWCPACKQFAGTWKALADWAEDTENGIRIGKVDITAESVLSGQFMVTHLPTIFHINNGEVRLYSEQRSLHQLQQYIEESQWKEQEPIPWWRSPTAKHMRLLGFTYWLSQKGKELQATLEQDYELPTYAVFIIIAVATIIVGLVLGGITVCCIEICIRMFSRKQAPPPHKIPRDKPPPTEEGVATEQKDKAREGEEEGKEKEGEEEEAEEKEEERKVERAEEGESSEKKAESKPRKRKGKKPRKED